MLVEKNRQTTVTEMMHTVTGGQADVPDAGVGDLALMHDRAQPGRGGTGTYGNAPQEGIMSPEGGTPNLSAG